MSESDAADPLPPRTDAAAETRAAAKWLVAAFAAVGAVLASGLGLSAAGTLSGNRLILALLGFTIAVLGVVAAISLIVGVLAPKPITLSELADLQLRATNGRVTAAEKALVEYVQNHPALLQGIAGDSGTAKSELIIKANENYDRALARRGSASETYFALAAELGTDDDRTKVAQEKAEVADSQAQTLHDTVRRLERLVDEQNTILSFRGRRIAVAVAAVFVAAGVATFAVASNPPKAPSADLRGAELVDVDLSGASLRGANLSGMSLKRVDLQGTNLSGANISKTRWKDTVCPDGTNSDNAGKTCAGHLSPKFRPDPLK